MSIADTLVAFESVFLLSQSLFVITVLAMRTDNYGIYRPLILFFFANVINQLPSILEPFSNVSGIRPFIIIFEILTIPAYLVLAPALWLYVRKLTAENTKQNERSDTIHFIPCFIAMLVGVALFIAPYSVRETIIGDGDAESTLFIQIITLIIMLLMLTWATQVACYISACLRLILKFRARLKDVFANTEGKELNWIIILITLLVLSVIVFIPDFMFGWPASLIWIPMSLDIALFTFLGIWGLRQKPGLLNDVETNLSISSFDKHLIVPVDKSQNDKDRPSDSTIIDKYNKYEKSALKSEDMARIAKKIETCMQTNKLYLAPNLSLGMLSSHIGVPANYVSQTLNAFIGMSFFDYINRERVLHTQSELIETNDTVLNIAINTGFNSRSSFYKAFKRETGLTPIAYRKKMAKKEA